MKNKFLELINKKRIYFDGGTGSVLQSRGLPVGTPPECWNSERPDEIVRLHREYLAAGADVIKTNTFGINPIKYPNYAEMIRDAVALARCAVSDSEGKLVAFDVGPLGRLLAPLGDLAFEDAVSIFRAVAEVAADAGVDMVLIETMNDSYETKAAVLGVREACSLPLVVTNAYDRTGKLMTGASPSAMIAMLEGLRVDAIGMNCSFGPSEMLQLLPDFVARSSLPIIVNPNAGIPEIVDGVTVYSITPSEFASLMRDMANSGATVLGGCCGTTPEYIAATVEATKDIPVALPTKKSITTVSSYTRAIDFSDTPVLVGERINPTGKPKLKDAIRAGDMDYIATEAVGECDRGAHILDINVGLPEIDEPSVMCRAITTVQGVVDAPLQIDSSDPLALSAAMRIYNGKPLVNSVNGKRESMSAVFPLVKKYGGAVIALTLDEGGIPDTAEGRVAIAEKITSEAAGYGIDKCDIIVDPLALSVSADPRAAVTTLRAIRMLADLGIKTSLGVSNVSFGLPARDKINAAFFTAALANGLSAAIMNPYSDAMTDAYMSYCALSGADVGCASYIAANQVIGGARPAEKTENISLAYAVRHGMRKKSRELAATALSSKDPMSVIDEDIIPALNEIGAAFESGRAYLPELLSCAEAASDAFDVVRERIPHSESDGRSVIIATVKGDIHDIGKNIVKVLLESYGFTVYDLGRDVAPEYILDAARERRVRLIGLSALMTTTVPAMKETVELLHRELPDVRVMVGGAVLTDEYAAMIGADYYGADAMSAVRIAEEFYKEEI